MEKGINAGVWIDGKQAVVVIIDKNGEKLEKIPSELESHVRTPGEGNQATRFSDQTFSDDKKKEEKLKNQKMKYYSNVISTIKHADHVMIIGPAESKIGLQKEMGKSESLASKLVLVDSEDYLTDNQIKEKVRVYFSEN